MGRKRKKLKASKKEECETTTSATIPSYLVICFLNFLSDFTSVYYTLEFFSLVDCINERITPKRTLLLHELVNPNMCFRYTSNDDGSGVLYAAGGLPPCRDTRRGFSTFIPESLPNVLTRIPLRKYNRILLDANKTPTPMNGGKLYPLIEEIDGLIYVLSLPSDSYGPLNKRRECTFEAYNPRDDTWTLLPELPLEIKARPLLRYSHLVYDHKLFVSIETFAYEFDTTSNTWSDAKELFSNYATTEAMRVGPNTAVPFEIKALPWKEQVFLCITPLQHDIMAAFRINQEDGKAVPLKLCYNGARAQLPIGQPYNLVDIGGDRFALLVRGEYNYEYNEIPSSVFTFKLEIDTTTEDRLILKDLTRCSGPLDSTGSYVYSFAC